MKPKSPACQWDKGRCICEDGAVVLQQTACPSENNSVHASIYYPSKYKNVAIIFVYCTFFNIVHIKKKINFD